MPLQRSYPEFVVEAPAAPWVSWDFTEKPGQTMVTSSFYSNKAGAKSSDLSLHTWDPHK